jgi:hypothetical protein
MRAFLACACLIAAACDSPARPASSAPAGRGGAGSDEPTTGTAGEATSNRGEQTHEPPRGAEGGDGTQPPTEPSAGGTPPGEVGGAGGDAGSPPVLVPDDGCSSKRYRFPTESEGEEMNPGFACIACHSAINGSGDGEAPLPAFAGTLYPTLREPYSCMGVAAQGAEVVIVDNNGVELRAIANGSGNFLVLDTVVAPPYSVKVSFEGRERAARTPHRDVDCNGCHTPGGDLGAPGRVILP